MPERVRLHHQRIDFADAAAFVSEHHRHHTPPVGHLFSIAALRGEDVVGVVIVGRPVARHRDDGSTAEVTRLCVRDGEPNACSFLYARAKRICLLMGYEKVITYTLASEPGASLKAAGAKVVGDVRPSQWGRPSRPRKGREAVQRLRWEL